jgi:hypothetical protein
VCDTVGGSGSVGMVGNLIKIFSIISLGLHT